MSLALTHRVIVMLCRARAALKRCVAHASVALVLVPLIAAACTSAATDSGVTASSSALSAADERILGFEAPANDWSSSQATVAESTIVTQGSSALAFYLAGWTEIESAELGSLGPVAGQLSVDLLLPEAVAWGELRFAVRSSSLGLTEWLDVGGIALQDIPAGSYQTRSVSLPASAVQALQGEYQDLHLRITLNGPSLPASPVLLDRLVFSGTSPAGGGDVPPAQGERAEFSISYATGTLRDATLIGATDSLRIDERAEISSVFTPTNLASFGEPGVTVGSSVLVYADVYAHGDIVLGSQSEVNGSLTTEGGVINLQDGSVIVRGAAETQALVPQAVFAWEVEFPATNQHLPSLTNGVVELQPGSYDQLRATGGEYRLTSGTYFFDDFVTESGSLVTADTSAGPVVIYIKNAWTYRGPIVTTGGREGSVLVGWLGETEAPLQAPFVGTVVAPHGKVELRRPTSGQHKGAFFGRSVHVFSDCKLTPIPFDWDRLPGAPTDTDGDGVPDDQDGCPLNPSKQARGLCGCSLSEADGDGDGTPDCIDDCPDDPSNTAIGTCGCVGTPFLAAEGTPCSPESCGGWFGEPGMCDGAGQCIGVEEQCAPSLVDRPGLEGECKAKEYGDSLYWICSGPVSRPDAELLCASEPGRQLAIIGRHAEGEWLRRQLAAGVHAGENDGGCQLLSTNGTWVFADCDTPAPFVCEQPKRYLPPPVDTRACSFHPDVSCEAVDGNEPGGSGDECVDPEDIGIPASPEVAAAEQAACVQACQAAGDPGCDEVCTGWMEVPTDECLEFGPLVRGRCEIDYSQDGTFDPTRTCDQCLPGEKCGRYYECTVPTPGGSLRDCTTSADCQLDEVCGTTAPYCMKVGLHTPCEYIDGQGQPLHCDARCFRGFACGDVNQENCASAENQELLQYCSDTRVCSPDTVTATPELVDSNMTPTPFEPSDFFPPVAEPAAEGYASPKPADCGGVGQPSCADVYALGEHPWCHFTPRPEDEAKPLEPVNVSDDSMALGDKRGRASTSALSFDFDPNLELNYDISGFNPLSGGDFEISAEASAAASASFNLLGAQGTVSILDAAARVAAERCSFHADAHLKLFGVDLLPVVFCGDPLADLENFANDSEFEAECAAAIDDMQIALSRAQKALRDAQELVRQYEELARRGMRFSPDLCEQLLGDRNVLPEGFPPVSDCDLLSPKDVIGLFINYYRYEVEQLVRRNQELIEGRIEGALPEFTYSIPLTHHEPIRITNVQDGQRVPRTVERIESDTNLGNCDEQSRKETQKIANVNFALGPIPMNMSIEAFLDYGVGGQLDFGLDSAALAKVILPEPGIPEQTHDLASAKLALTPYANAGIEMFVGVGFEYGPVAAKVGLSGHVMLGNVQLPAYGGAALTLAAEVDTRPPPTDFLGIMPSYTLLFPDALPQRIKVGAGYRFGLDAKVTDILSGAIDAKARVEFFFFSKTWTYRILDFNSQLRIEQNLIFVEQGAPLAEAETPLAMFQVPVPFPNFGALLNLPDLPPYNPREFDGVRSLQTLEEVDPDDPRYVDFDPSRAGELFYDGYCGDPLPECLEPGEECGSSSLGCCGGRQCVASPFLGVPSVCKDCAGPGDVCTAASDCCDNGYGTMRCYEDSEGSTNSNTCQRCIGAGLLAVAGADSNDDGVVDGGCCTGLHYREQSPSFTTCEYCLTAGDACQASSDCCSGHRCNTSGVCERNPPQVPR